MPENVAGSLRTTRYSCTAIAHMEVVLLFITRHIASGAESFLRCNWSTRSFAASGKSGGHGGNETDTAAAASSIREEEDCEDELGEKWSLTDSLVSRNPMGRGCVRRPYRVELPKTA